MRIGVVTPSISPEEGGLLDSVRRLSVELGRLRNDVEVLTVGNAADVLDPNDWKPARVRIFDRRGPKRFGYSPALKKAMCNLDCDVVLSQGLWRYTSVATLNWHSFSGKPYIANPHGMLDPWALKQSTGRKEIAARLYEKKHLKRSACIRALSLAEVQAIRDYGLRNPVCLIPNGVDTAPVAQKKTAPWANVPFLRNKKILLALGRIHPKKNLSAVLRAWKQASDNSDAFHNWALVIAGPDELETEDKLRQLTAELDLMERVWFAGALYGKLRDAAYP